MCSLKEFNVTDVLQKLSKKRPLFHNERDFQFELALMIKDMYECEIRLEYYYKTDVNGKRCYIDIIAFDENYRIAFELKYKAKKFKGEAGSENYDLKEQSAQDHGCVYVLSDLKRLEALVNDNNPTINKGYVIFITNDTKYTEKGFRQGSMYENFSLKQGRKIEKNHPLIFNTTKNISETSAKHFEGITFTYSNTYEVNWEDYNDCSEDAKAYQLVFEIPPKENGVN